MLLLFLGAAYMYVLGLVVASFRGDQIIAAYAFQFGPFVLVALLIASAYGNGAAVEDHFERTEHPQLRGGGWGQGLTIHEGPTPAREPLTADHRSVIVALDDAQVEIVRGGRASPGGVPVNHAVQGTETPRLPR